MIWSQKKLSNRMYFGPQIRKKSAEQSFSYSSVARIHVFTGFSSFIFTRGSLLKIWLKKAKIYERGGIFFEIFFRNFVIKVNCRRQEIIGFALQIFR